MQLKDKSALLRYLKSQRLMGLATFDKKPWICTIYYAVDKDFCLYFVSSPKSKHCQDIEKNNEVSCAIYDSHTLNSAKKTGVQMQGTASQVKGWERIKVILKMWQKAAPGMEDVVNVKNMRNKVISSRAYKVKPTFIKFFNQKLYGEDGFRKFKF
ncbi:hypothetical protein A2597_03020 [Candidatus Woesebacteria bacterium RIFOXYD1_FULL_46_19]|uniref:Uncharacterized protein n=1 Tax=Candidatus Woesebacteria bacterium RIFOXYD1_FULL_46_19 TaxID=1802552 RepID=A0A1F8DLE2_9BACT|nr:MAG: hypothetical protein A2597_03020 [Candidatus Woesebacteria bacterium RIFOXYD1_FULL_46_19]